MRYRTVSVRELGGAEIAAWGEIARGVPELASPYFRPEFARAVAAERERVFVTIIEDGGRPVGFFPFERTKLGEGRVLGRAIADFEGVIAGPEAEWSVPELLAASGLSCWRFDHLIVTQAKFQPYVKSTAPSPRIDISQGYEAFAASRRAEGTKHLQKVEGLARKLEREVGPIRVVADERDPAVLDKVMEWKSGQCRATGQVDVFGVAWTRALMHRLLTMRGEEFGGVLSALYIGDELAAAHMGMRSRPVWHYWFPSYDEKWGKFSPGVLLLMRLAAEAPGMGISVIDLGKGESDYKRRLANASVDVCEGLAERPALMTTLRRWQSGAEKWSEGSAMGKPLRPVLKRLRTIEWKRKLD